MAIERLTNIEIKKLDLRPKATPQHPEGRESERFIADGGGLYVQVRPAAGGGVHKTFVYKYSSLVKPGKREKIYLGKYPTLTLEKARKLARAHADKLKHDKKDPREAMEEARREEARQRARLDNTFGKAADLWVEHASKGWTTGDKGKSVGRLKNHVLPKLRKRPMDLIELREVAEVIKVIIDRGSLDTAKRVRQDIRNVFDHAQNLGMITPQQNFMHGNTTVGGKFRIIRKHYPGIIDLELFAQLLRDIDGYMGKGPAVRACLQFTAYMAQRGGQTVRMRWEHVNLDKREWYVDGENRKMKSKEAKETARVLTVPMSHQAVEILREMEEFTGGETGYIFQGKDKNRERPISNDNTLNAALRCMGYVTSYKSEEAKQGTAHCMHGFRTSFQTIAQEVFGSWVASATDRQLLHEPKILDAATNNGTAYNRGDLIEERRELMQCWADFIDALKDLKEANDESLKRIKLQARKALIDAMSFSESILTL